MEEIIKAYKEVAEKTTGINLNNAKAMVCQAWYEDKWAKSVTFEISDSNLVLICEPNRIALAVGTIKLGNGAFLKVWDVSEKERNNLFNLK